jgi:signal transduction histidine kinase
MKTEAAHPIFLYFADKDIEKSFTSEYDCDNRIFYRIGIYLSCFAWFIWYSGLYFSHRNVFGTALTTLIIFLLLPFIIVVTLSFYKKYSTLTHNITAFCNFAAACICIYVAVYLSKDITFLCTGIICISFFCYFILRIRFKMSLLITFSYAIIAQLCVLTSNNFSNYPIFTASTGIWLGFFIAMVAGYFFEKINRKIFLQNALIREQQEELINEKNKLKQSLENLKATQAQLIQKEKMASLGELTTGIAHEIQNPLNFVNNFSAVNKELLTEVKQEFSEGNYAEVSDLLVIIGQNEEKITHHGKRADNIVKGMLQHARSSSGEEQLTNINHLVDEYLRLSYQGMRDKDKAFSAAIETHFDDGIRAINIVPQDVGRVLLNLFNNAFYAVQQKKKQLNGTYEPTVTVSTRKDAENIVIKVKDNGNGIPPNVTEKVFQPFFTTKPTGEGTGLGLSLSYDIITKGHGGNLRVSSKEGEGAEFVVELPAS